MSDELRIKPDLTKLAEAVTVDQYFLLRDNDLVSMIELLSQFVVDEAGEYLSPEEGRKLLGTLKVSSVFGLFNRFMSEVETIAVPLASVKG